MYLLLLQLKWNGTDLSSDRAEPKHRRDLSLGNRSCPRGIDCPFQDRGSDSIETLFKLADKIEQRYQKASSYVDQLTQSILAKAFQGELVPQDPNDEPVSVLLERIRAEREAEAKAAKKSTGKKGG